MFDLILLGLGADGHTASLFPGTRAIRESARWVLGHYVDAQKGWRITLTPPVINTARTVVFIVAGAGKAPVLRDILEGPFRPDVLPAQVVRPDGGELRWMLDRDAAASAERKKRTNHESTAIDTACRSLFCFSPASPAGPGGAQSPVLLREEFQDLTQWRPVTFPKIKEHSEYTIEYQGRESVLRAESRASASAIVYRNPFNVYDYPRLRWKWKVMNVYEKGNARTKEGDDYPLRIYVLFEYDPDKAGFYDAMKYGLAKIVLRRVPALTAR